MSQCPALLGLMLPHAKITEDDVIYLLQHASGAERISNLECDITNRIIPYVNSQFKYLNVKKGSSLKKSDFTKSEVKVDYN